MAPLNIYKEPINEYTVISNHFIDYYMEDANEAQLQVYLYLLRMTHANLPVSVSDIANKFKHSEKEVLRALKYWELQKLLSLDFDKDKNLIGIHLERIPQETAEISVVNMASPILSVSAPVTPIQTNATPATTLESTETRSEAVTAVAAMSTPQEEPSIYVKPTYTADQLRAFKEREGSAQLLFIAQTYVGKPLSVSDVKTIYFMWDVLHFSDDLIDYLIQYCVERGKKDFRYMEKVAINWAEEGITTPKQAQKAAAKYEKSVYSVMNALGKSSTPTTKELEYINRWAKEYGFTNDIIIEACERTVLATDKHRFEYAESILSSWKRENVQHKSDISKIDSQYQKQKSSKSASANRFNQFTQNTYDFEELEKELLSN